MTAKKFKKIRGEFRKKQKELIKIWNIEDKFAILTDEQLAAYETYWKNLLEFGLKFGMTIYQVSWLLPQTIYL